MAKIVAPLRLVINLSMVSMGCFSRRTALLASRISPFFLGTTIGLIQAVGPSTFSIMSRSSRCFNSRSTSLRMWNGMLRCFCCLGVMSVSMCY